MNLNWNVDGGDTNSINNDNNINNNGTFMDAVITSFVSMFDYRVVQYKIQQQQQQLQQQDYQDLTTTVEDTVDFTSLLDPKITIVVQEQIDAVSSGVAFSFNPSNNCYDEIMITANFGLGETVVAGTVTPDVYIVEHNGKQPQHQQPFQILEKTIGSKQTIMRLDDDIYEMT